VNAPEDLTEDHFLGGRLRLLQPRHGYRAATDPVMLAAAVPARAGQSVLELGCGAGAEILCLGVRVPGLTLHGVELQPGYAALARRNATENGLALAVTEADLRALPSDLRALQFDHVMANPPFFDPSGPASADPGRALARHEDTPLADWIAAGLARTRTGGTFTVIHRAERLGAILSAQEARGGITVLPLAAREGRTVGRVIVQTRKGGRQPLRLLFPLVLHAGSAHSGDGDDFTDRASAVLRGSVALDLG